MLSDSKSSARSLGRIAFGAWSLALGKVVTLDQVTRNLHHPPFPCAHL